MDTPGNTPAIDTDVPAQNVDWKAEFEKAEKRRKDTQAAFTKSQQTLKSKEAELHVLKANVGLGLTPEELKPLEDLKFSDPDAWRVEVNKLEDSKKSSLNAKIAETTAEFNKQDELQRRISVLEEFNQANPGLVITDEVLQFDVPRRITNKLETGAVSFEDFLAEVKEYLTTPKTVKTVGVEQQPDLGKVGGGSIASPSEKAVKSSYETQIF